MGRRKKEKKFETRNIRFFLDPEGPGFMAIDAAMPGLTGGGLTRMEALADLDFNRHEMHIANRRSIREDGNGPPSFAAQSSAGKRSAEAAVMRKLEVQQHE